MNTRYRYNIGQKLRSAIHLISPPKPRPLILVYHRIAKDPIDNWGLSVSPERFKEQLEVLRRTRRPVSLDNFVRDLFAGTLSSDAVAITFDDGYADNLVAGKPLLTAADIPATVFLATGYLNQPVEFWWDELSRLMLTGTGTQNLQLEIDGKAVNVGLGAGRPPRNRWWFPSATLRTRRTALTQVWELMRRVGDEERHQAMNAIRSQLTDEDKRVERGRAMTSEEVDALTSGGLVSIGAHTISHPLLTALPAADQRQEITQSKSACEALIGRPVTGFAYPFGASDSNARKAVSDANFAYACSTRHAPASPSSDAFALPRIQICNWNGDSFQRALHRWSAES
jgi:peptidoglycan/xylan/chitin deacetylase (PgdA/CDA1 family)